MYQKLEECPSCKHTLFSNFLICTDHSVSQESFALVKCQKCELVFTNPRPDEKKIADYYKSEEYISHTNKSNNLINIVYKVARYFTLRSKYKLIHKLKKSGNILDFGSGSGHFIRFMANKGWNAFGYDALLQNPSDNRVTYLNKISQINEQEKFHIITAWHTLEHVHELRGTLKILRKSLKKGGLIFIAVPNINCYDANHYGAKWAAYDVPRHLYHFTQTSFQKLVSSLKLTIVQTLPMKLDAYYVSWLSQKYSGSNNILKAMKVGMTSNNIAKQNGEYSSLIYVLKA